MNYAPFHTPYAFLNLCTVIFLCMPALAVLARAETRKVYFVPVPIVFLLFLAVAIVNNSWIDTNDSLRNHLTAASFLMLSPLVLGFLPFFIDKAGRITRLKPAIQISLIGYLLSGLIVFTTEGLTENTGSMVSGTGYLLVMLFSLPIFVRQVGDTVHKRNENGKAFMIASIVFSFACYVLFFLLHFVPSAGMQTNDLFLLFQLTTIFFALLMTVGILLYKTPPVVEPPAPKADKLPMLTEWEDFKR
jgi:hypothetical protein